MSTPVRAAALALTLALAFPAQAEPFLLASVQTLRGGSLGGLVLPDGSAVGGTQLAEALRSISVPGEAIVVVDLGPAGTVFVPGAAGGLDAGPFLTDLASVIARPRGAARFDPLPAGVTLEPILAATGAVAFQPRCARGALCPQPFLADGVFRDGFESP